MNEEEAKEHIIARLKELERKGMTGSRAYAMLKLALKEHCGIDWDEREGDRQN